MNEENKTKTTYFLFRHEEFGVGGVTAVLLLYQTDILLGFSDPLHFGEIWYGCASTHRFLVLYLPVTNVTEAQNKTSKYTEHTQQQLIRCESEGFL